MIFIVFLFILATSSAGVRDVAPWWSEYSHEHTTKASHSTHWWERFTTASEAWWNKFTTKTTATTTTISIPLEILLVTMANFTLTPFQAIKLMEDRKLLNDSIAYFVQKIFGEEKPELYEIVAKWLSSHINRTLTRTAPAEEIEYITDTTDNRPIETNIQALVTEQVTDPVSSDNEKNLVTMTDLDAELTDMATGSTNIDSATDYEQATDNGKFTEINHEMRTVTHTQAEDTTSEVKKREPSYIDSFGRPVTVQLRFQRPGPQQNLDLGLRESGPQLPPVPQGSQDSQGHQIRPQGPMGLSRKLPFVVTQKVDSPVTVTETTTVSTTEAETEVTTRHEYFGRQIIEYNDLFDRPDYEDMEGYISRPDMVNEGTTILALWGVVSSTTTTEHPLILTIKKDMADSKNGFFTSFVKKTLELLATMERDQAGYLFAAADIVSNDMDREGLLRFLGVPLQPAWLRVTSVLASIPPEVAQSNAVIAHKALSDPAVLPADMKRIFKIVDSVYNMKEGDDLFASLVDMEGYPENNVTSRKVIRKVINAILQPFNRLKESPRLNTILNRLNEAIEENYPYRRNENTRVKDFVLQDINIIKPQNANVIKNSLKNKHRGISENGSTVKELKEPIRIFSGFKNRFLKEQDFDKKVERISKILMSDKKMQRKPQTRFNIIEKVEGQTDGKLKSGIEKSKPITNKIEISKYLSRYTLKTKPNRKQVKKVYPKNDDTPSEERDLKFNLQDTLRHGDRKFVERNYKTRNSNIIHALSSYSDEEGVLKNNIYKVFGYTQ